MAENEDELPIEENLEDNMDLGSFEDTAEGNTLDEGFAMPSHLETDLGEDEISESEDNSVEEAMQAWVAGGRVIEDDADAVLPVQFAQLEPPIELPEEVDNNRLNNVSVNVTVELGHKKMTVSELVNLKEQDVIDLSKLAGEAFDILVNNRPFAEGEIVVVTDLMAVRITRLRPFSTESSSTE
jgi:flagellar motor switch protein FliN/FliY